AQRWGPFCLPVGVVTGGLLETVLLWRVLTAHGMRLIPKWNGLDPSVRTVLRQYMPMLGAAFLMGGTALVDQSMAAMLSGGSVAALSYASKVISVVMAIGSLALSTAALPYFSQMAARGDWYGCRHTLKRYTVLVLVVTVPST